MCRQAGLQHYDEAWIRQRSKELLVGAEQFGFAPAFTGFKDRFKASLRTPRCTCYNVIDGQLVQCIHRALPDDGMDSRSCTDTHWDLHSDNIHPEACAGCQRWPFKTASDSDADDDHDMQCHCKCPGCRPGPAGVRGPYSTLMNPDQIDAELSYAPPTDEIELGVAPTDPIYGAPLDRPSESVRLWAFGTSCDL